MIFIDAKIFGTDENINLLLDEEASVSDVLYKIFNKEKCDLSDYFVVSERNRYFLSKNLSLKAQGVRGGDKLIIIRKEA